MSEETYNVTYKTIQVLTEHESLREGGILKVTEAVLTLSSLPEPVGICGYGLTPNEAVVDAMRAASMSGLVFQAIKAADTESVNLLKELFRR